MGYKDVSVTAQQSRADARRDPTAFERASYEIFEASLPAGGAAPDPTVLQEQG